MLALWYMKPCRGVTYKNTEAARPKRWYLCSKLQVGVSPTY